MAAAIALSSLFPNKPTLADGCPVPTFTAPQTFGTGPGCAVSVAVGDFNGDGKADMVVGNKALFDGNVFNVSVLLGKGDGTFEFAVNYNAGANPVSVAVGDFDGDGRADLVTGNESYTRIFSMLLGKGDGTFGTAYSSGERWSPVSSIATGDFNGDGKLDLAAANFATFDPNSNSYTNGSVVVLLGNGDGTFQVPASYSAGLYPYSVAVSDLNGDGKLDLAVASQGSTNISVFLGNGDGSFLLSGSYGTGLNPRSIAVGDLNGDGKLDVVVANYGSGLGSTNGSVSVLLGNGDGTFRATVNSPIASSPVSVGVGDFNGDGKSDVALANYPSKNLSVLLGNGDGTFQSPVSFSAGGQQATSTQSLVVGDFNGDGRPDLAVADCSGVSVLLNTCSHAGVRLAIAPLPLN